MTPLHATSGQVESPTIYLCYEPCSTAFAGKLAEYRRSNHDVDEYESRTTRSVSDPESAHIKERLRKQIAEADLLVCIVDQATFADEWIGWEIAQAVMPECNKPLVGVLLREHNRRPASMHNRGAIIVPFKSDAIRRAIEWALSKEASTEDYTLLDD